MNTLVTAMEARMTAAESLAEELQMENDGMTVPSFDTIPNHN